MKAETQSIQGVFSKNRAEEFGYDVWEDFAVPLFYDKLDLKEATKPRVVVGGRGCGKTMLLRYLSHYSTFSTKRRSIQEREVSHIGLYWKADTQFCRMLNGRGMDDDVWAAAFHHAIAVLIGAEVLRALESIANSQFQSLDANQLARLSYAPLRDFAPDLAGSHAEVAAVLRSKCWQFEMWANNARRVDCPSFLPGRLFLLALLSVVRQQIPLLSDSRFCVYIDEYENLTENQKRIINTCIKHSEQGLQFSVATKRHGMTTRGTEGDEQITDTADYRTHDLDAYLQDNAFDLFAAEVLLLRLTSAGATGFPISADELRDPDSLEHRSQPSYRKTVLQCVQGMLPQLSQRELAQHVFEQPSLVSKLKSDIGKALAERHSSLKSDSFVRPAVPEASVICPALLYRRSPDPESVLANLDAAVDGQANHFTGKRNWVHNNFIGCLLQLYAPYSRACPFYAGLDTFVQLSHGNIRHFLELCYKSLRIAKLELTSSELRVDPEDQAEAARQASAALLSEVRSFGQFGNRLHSFVLTVGSILHLAHRRPAQSEPEVSHFSVLGGGGLLPEEDQQFLREAVKWSVLFEEGETKIKDGTQPAAVEWILNPIYAPYFHISYRKRRKHVFTPPEVTILIRGTYEARRDLLQKLRARWAVDSDELQLPLFAHVGDGEVR